QIMAEVFGTYFIIFAGCGACITSKLYPDQVTSPGVSVAWGLIVMVMIFTVAHVSGAHFNPAVTVTNAVFGRMPWKEAPIYIVAQLMAATLASFTLDSMFPVTEDSFYGTLPAGSAGQSLAVEIFMSFLLMFVISGSGTDTRSIGDSNGVVVGMTIMLNCLAFGAVSGASMNPARSIGPAIARHEFRALWVYVVGPIAGMITGAFAYNMLRETDKPLRQLTRSRSFLKGRTKH
ncbi:hypothetical protein M569_10132, partial [Genlisea aurea]